MSTTTTLLSFSSASYQTHHHQFLRPKQPTMATLPIAFSTMAANSGRVYATTATKSSGGSEEKSILDWILGALLKEDQLLETDPILKKVEERGTASGGRGKSNSVDAPKEGKKTGGGLGGLFAKK